MQGSNAFPDEWRTAVDDLSMLDLPQVDRVADPRGAAELLIDTLDGDATLITLGPFTNIAEALRADPGLASRVPAVVSMAGAIDVAGNTPNGVAEYNVWVDPLAAKEVIEEMPVTLVPLDATDDVPFTTFFVDALTEHAVTPEASAAQRIIPANEPIFTSPGYSFWDTLATALVFRPKLAAWDEAPVMITASQDAGAGWIDRWDSGFPSDSRAGCPTRSPSSASTSPCSRASGDRVRPDPDITVSFDGERCAIRPRHLVAGELVIGYADALHPEGAGAILTGSATRSRTPSCGRSWDGTVRSCLRYPASGRARDHRVRPSGSGKGHGAPIGDRGGVCVGGRRGPAPRIWLSAPVEVAP